MIETLLWLIVMAAIIGGLAALGVWVISQLGVPDPLSRVLTVVIVVVAAAMFVLYALPLLPVPHPVR